MSEERENYCKLLGLNPFKNDGYREEDVLKRINDSEAAWNRELIAASTIKKRKYALSQYLKLLPDIRSTMDSTVLKEEEFENARKILRRKATKIWRGAIILHNGDIVIPQAVAEDFAKRLKWDNIDGRTIINASGLKTVTFQKPVNISISTAFQYINDLGYFSPVDFINDLIELPELGLKIAKVSENSSHDDLRLIYDTVGKRLGLVKSGKIPNQDAYIQAIRSVKANLSPDDKYNELFTYGKCMKILDPAFEQMDEDAGDPFTRAYIDNLMTTYVNENEADAGYCIKLLEDFCIKRMYPANFSQENSTLKTCPHCKSMISIGPNCEYCPTCGSAINSICPACGTAQTSANIHCIGCGINLPNALNTSREMEDGIRKLLSSGMTESASEEIVNLENSYPQAEAIPQLKAKLRESSDKISLLAEQISSEFLTMNYYSVKKTVEAGKTEFPSLLKREDIRNRYEEACAKVSKADAMCVSAVEVEDEKARDIYIAASEICPDLPDAVAKLRNYPPRGPADAEFQVGTDSITLDFAVPEDMRGVTFCVYRKDGSFPDVDQTTKPLDEVTTGRYTDKTAEPGVDYYYRIYSKRWGVLSEEYAECGPALIMCEVTNVSFAPAEDGLQITYQIPRGAESVLIWRKEAGLMRDEGDEDEVTHNNSGTVIDSGLKGGMGYNYLFAAVYNVGGRPERSCGTVFSAMTEALPQPVTDLEIRWDRKQDNYIATWSGNDDTILYYSTDSGFEPSEHMSVMDVNNSMTRIERLESDEEVFRFNLPSTTMVYVYPTITIGNTVVIGKKYIIANLRPFRNISKSVDGFNCRLSMDWPEEAEYVEWEIKGKNPDGSDRHEGSELSREDYEAAKCIEINLGGSTYTEVILYAVYMINGEPKRSIGLGTEIFSGDYSKVVYYVDKESVKGDRKKTRITVEFDCPGQTLIPRCLMVASAEGIPLREKDGEVIWESDDPIILTDGSTKCDFVLDKGDADISKMRLFFPDKSDYDKYRFVHPLYNRRK